MVIVMVMFNGNGNPWAKTTPLLLATMLSSLHILAGLNFLKPKEECILWRHHDKNVLFFWSTMTQLLLVTIFNPSPNPLVRWYLFYQKSIIIIITIIIVIVIVIIIITIIIILFHLQRHNWSENRDGSFSCSKSSRRPQWNPTAWTDHWMTDTIRQKDKDKDTIERQRKEQWQCQQSVTGLTGLQLPEPITRWNLLSKADWTFSE